MCYRSVMATKKDFTQAAHAVFLQATGVVPIKTLSKKQIAGRMGGLVGGKKRMGLMTDEEKAKLSALGVAARKTPASGDAGAGEVTKPSR